LIAAAAEALAPFFPQHVPPEFFQHAHRQAWPRLGRVLHEDKEAITQTRHGVVRIINS